MKLTSIIKEIETSGVLNLKKFNPENPDVSIPGFGVMTRNDLRIDIIKRLNGVLKTAKRASQSNASYDLYKSLTSLLEPDGILLQMINTEIKVAEQLETLRKKGGQRENPIPKQF